MFLESTDSRADDRQVDRLIPIAESINRRCILLRLEDTYNIVSREYRGYNIIMLNLWKMHLAKDIRGS